MTYRVTWDRLGRDARIGGAVQEFDVQGELELAHALSAFAAPYLHSPVFDLVLGGDGTFTIRAVLRPEVTNSQREIGHGRWELVTDDDLDFDFESMAP